MQKIRYILVLSLLVPMDLALFIISFFVSYGLRYRFDIPSVSFEPFKESFLAIGLIYVLIFALMGVFRKRFSSHGQLIKKVSYGIVLGTLVAFVFVYVFRIKWSSFPSSVFLLVIPIGTILVSTANIIVYRTAKLLKTNIVVIGGEKDEEVFINRSQVEICHVKNIEEILHCKNIDEVLICEHIHDDSQLNLLIYLLNKLNVNVNFKPSLYDALLLGNIAHGKTLSFLATSLGTRSDLEESLIRLLDVVGSLLLICFSAPLMLIFSILIKLTSAGPVFYKQKRVGKNGDTFTLYKFRTMINDAEKLSGFTPAECDDLRITKVGRTLRITRLDELPQLLNVLQGKMSLVGPRPENLYRVNLHKALQGIRLAVKPGLTGLAQIRSYYDLRPRHKIKYDFLYIQRRSFLLNIYILLKTIPVVFSKKGW